MVWSYDILSIWNICHFTGLESNHGAKLDRAKTSWGDTGTYTLLYQCGANIITFQKKIRKEQNSAAWIACMVILGIITVKPSCDLIVWHFVNLCFEKCHFTHLKLHLLAAVTHLAFFIKKKKDLAYSSRIFAQIFKKFHGSSIQKLFSI